MYNWNHSTFVLEFNRPQQWGFLGTKFNLPLFNNLTCTCMSHIHIYNFFLNPCGISYFSYISNPSMGDAHSVEVELAHMRHTKREQDEDMAMILGKVSYPISI